MSHCSDSMRMRTNRTALIASLARTVPFHTNNCDTSDRRSAERGAGVVAVHLPRWRRVLPGDVVETLWHKLSGAVSLVAGAGAARPCPLAVPAPALVQLSARAMRARQGQLHASSAPCIAVFAPHPHSRCENCTHQSPYSLPTHLACVLMPDLCSPNLCFGAHTLFLHHCPLHPLV